MKKKKNWLFAGVSVGIMCLCGCNPPVFPSPLDDTNAKPLPMPLPTYSDIRFFEEFTDPLRIQLKETDSAEIGQISDEIKLILQDRNVKFSSGREPFDLQIVLQSDFRTLSPEPNCRMAGTLRLSVFSSDSVELLPVYQSKTESRTGLASAQEAKKRILTETMHNLKEWKLKEFIPAIENKLEVSIVRFRMSQSRNEILSYFEADKLEVLKKLQNLAGVRFVRIIESNEKNRIVSYRVMYEKELIPNGIAGKWDK